MPVWWIATRHVRNMPVIGHVAQKVSLVGGYGATLVRIPRLISGKIARALNGL
jgi:hypothetical protein